MGDTPLSAPAGLARRFCGDASVDAMSVTSLRKHSPPNTMARHRTFRHAMTSASAKMPRRLCILGVVTDRKLRDTERTDATLSAPGGPARHFWADASVNYMSATALRQHSHPHKIACHRTLRRTMALYASAELLSRVRQNCLCFSVFS